MKKIKILNLLVLILVIQLGCKTKNPQTFKYEIDTFNTVCPEDGVCTFEVIKNKSIQLKQDGIGALYTVLKEGKSHILKFEYKRNEIANVQDGHYSEIIYLEVLENELDVQIEDANLQNVKLLFGRFCYCKGQTGYYKITNGNLNIKKRKTNNLYDIHLIFKTDEVPQIITEIYETFSL